MLLVMSVSPPRDSLVPHGHGAMALGLWDFSWNTFLPSVHPHLCVPVTDPSPSTVRFCSS